MAGRLLLLTMALGVASFAHAESHQHRTADSQTAMAITGDIDLSPSKIVFENKVSLRLSCVGSGRGITWMDSARDRMVQIFRIAQPSNVKLLNGNALCGSQIPPGCVTAVQRAAPRVGTGATPSVLLYLTVFTGDDELNQTNYASRICAGYTYFAVGLATPKEALGGTDWELVELGGSPLTTRQAQNHVHFRLDPSAKRMQGFAGCNQIAGGYRLDGDQLSFPAVATTRMFCQGSMELESAFLKALGATSRYRVTGQRLELYQGQRLLAVFHALQTGQP